MHLPPFLQNAPFSFRLHSLPNPRHPAGVWPALRESLNHDLHLIHVVEGAAEFRLGDGRRAVGTPGNVVCIPPFHPYTCHRHRAGRVEMVNLHFLLTCQPAGAQESWLALPLLFEPKGLPRWHRRLRACLRLWVRGEPESLWECSLRLHELVAAYAAQFGTAAPPGPGDRAMHQARLALEQAGSFRAAAVARAAGMSLSQFNRRFRAACGLSPKSYWQHCRLRLARGLLEEGDHSIKEVAERLGFANPYYFSRWFRQMQGEPPQPLPRSPLSGALIDRPLMRASVNRSYFRGRRYV